MAEEQSDYFEQFMQDSGHHLGEEYPTSAEAEIACDCDHLPTFLRDLLTKGMQEPIEFNISLNDKPKWLDVEKFKRGQKFAVENLISTLIADGLSTLLLFSFKPILIPLLFTGCTDTPIKSIKRYDSSTFLKITSWYKENFWGEENNTAKSNLAFVKSAHKRVFEKVNNCPKNEFDTKISTTVRNPNYKFVCKDAISEDAKKISSYPYIDTKPTKEGDLWMNQADMSVTQFTFVGLFVTYPKSFGVSATENDFEDFIHMWKGLGFLLGIKDEYNFCNGDLKEIRQRTKDFIEYIFKPSMKYLTDDWEHMTRCVFDGARFHLNDYYYFESNLLLLFHILKMDMPKFNGLVPFYQRFAFYVFRFFLFFVIRIPFVTTWARNWLDKKMKYLANAPPEVWGKWGEREFPYIRKKTEN